MSKRRMPRPLSEVIAPAVGEAAPKTVLATVQGAWDGAVGAAIAREAAPVSERDGVVTVACSSATWAQELDLLAPRIEKKLRSSLPPEARFERLRFIATAD